MAKAQALPPDFAALLDKPLDTFERPAWVPAGTYTGVIKAFRFGASRFDKERGTVIFIDVILTGATEDCADPEAVENFDFSKLRNLSREYSLGSGFNDFLESLGHDTKGKGANEFLPLLPGTDVLVEVTMTDSKTNEKDHFNNVKRIMGA